MSSPFTYQTVVRLHQTDAAGLLFFARQFELVHDCYEAYLHLNAVSFARLLKDRDYLLPIISANGNYAAPLMAGDQLVISMICTSCRANSFELTYELFRGDEAVGRASTVHVCIDFQTRLKRPLPEPIRLAMQAIAS